MAKVPGNLGLARMVCEVRVDPTLAVYQHLMTLGSQLEEGFRHWQTDGNSSIRFVDAGSRSAALVQHNRFVVEMDLPQDTYAFEVLLHRVAKAYMKLPHIKSVLRVGVRGHYFISKGLAFEELLAVFEEKLLKLPALNAPFLSGKMRDLMFNVVVDRTPHVLHLIAGPVQKKELGMWTRSINYDIGEPPEPIEYPDVAAFLDIDVYVNGAMKADKPEDLASKGLAIMASTAKAFSEYLFEGAR